MKKNLLLFVIVCFCVFAICIGNVGKLTARADSATQEQYNASAEISNAGENGARSIGDDMFHETIDVGEPGTTSPISIVDLLDENEHPDADTVEGKRISYSDILLNMDVFAENYTACCGLVSMGIVLQYYHELTTQFQGQYIPDEWYYNSTYQGTPQAKANALRDYLREVTDLVAWGAFGDYTMPSGQSVGIKEYLRNYGPNATYFVNSKTWCLDTTNDIVSALNANIPVLVNCMDYKILNSDGTYVDKGNHVVVAYGYRRYNDKLQFLAHIGYQSLPTTYMPPEENPDPNEKYTSAWIEVDATYGYMYFGAMEADCYTTTNIDGTTDCTVALDYSWDDSVIVPRVLDGMNVVGIANNGFANKENVEHVELRDNIDTIGGSAFFTSGLKTIVLSSGLLSIENSAFANTPLQEIKIPSTVQDLGTGIFANCTSLRDVELPYGITEIPEACFVNCYSLEEFVIPASVTTINEDAFFCCIDLMDIVIPNGVSTIRARAFDYCESLEHFLLPDTVVFLGTQTFANCNNLTVYIETHHVRPLTWSNTWGDCVDQVWGCTFSLDNSYVVSFYKSNMIDRANDGFNEPQRKGCTFLGWCKNEDFTNETVYSMSTITQAYSNFTYFTGWNGSTVAITYKDMYKDTFSGTHISGYPTTHTNNTTTTLKSATKLGYTFKGWHLFINGVYTNVTNISAESSFEYQVTLYAKWERNPSGGGGGGGGGRIEEFMPTVTPDEPEDESDF